MAITIDELQIEIQAKGAESADGINALTTSLSALKKTINKSLLAKLSDLSSALDGIKAPITVNMNVKGMEQLKKLVQEATANIPANASNISPTVDGSAVASEMGKIKASTEQAAGGFTTITSEAKRAKQELKSAGNAAGEAGKNLKETGASAKRGASGLNKFVSSLKRIALYRAIRFILKNITSAIKEGIQNLVLYSKAIGGIDASKANATMSQFASIGMQVKNTLGSALMPVLNALMPVIQTLANWFIIAANAVNQFFAAISGASMWTKAKEYAVDYADGLGKAAGAASDLKNAMLGIDELNVISPPGGGGGGGAGALDYGEMFESAEISDKIKKIAEKIEPIINWVRENFETLLGLAVDIGAAILTWKLSKGIVSGLASLKDLAVNAPKLANALKFAAGLVITIVGVKWSYEGGFAIGSGKSEFMDVVKAVLGPIAAGVGGALMGSAIMPGIGTAVGFAIGLTLGVVFEIVGVFKGAKQAAIDAFYASDFGAGVAAVNEKVAEIMQIDADLKVRIANITGEVDASTMADFAAAQQLIDEIFAMDSSNNKTAAEIAIIQEKINALNSLGLDGIQLAFDETTGKVQGTKEEIQAVMDSLLEQYRIEAMRDAYIESYKTQYDSLVNLKDANEQVEIALGNFNTAMEASDEIAQKLAETEERLAEIRSDDSWSTNWFSNSQEVRDEYHKLYLQANDLREELKSQNTALDETKTSLADAKQALSESFSTYEAAVEKVGKIESALVELTAAVGKQIDPATEDAKNIMSGIAGGIADGESEVKTAMETAMDNMLKAERLLNGINSPSTVYAGEGKYVMQGMANGIADNASLVTDSFKSVLNDMLGLVEQFTSKVASALNAMLSSFASSMSDMSVSASGNVSYSSMSGASIPRFASGGYPVTGQMFLARESGPEMVGTIGNRTAVANNDQIVQAVSEGVYEAVVAAMARAGGGENTSVNVYLDGKQINASVRKTQREKGAGILQSGVVFA